MIDESAHKVFDYGMKDWHGFCTHKCSHCSRQLDIYYCESRLYLVRCKHCKIVSLVEAGNPNEAAEKVSRRAEPENKALTITLPCKVGDTVYYIAWHEKQPIKRGTVWLFGMDETHVWANITVSKTSVVTMNVDNLYLTREVAEQALSARRPEDAK